jgi:hypothetical protein
VGDRGEAVEVVGGVAGGVAVAVGDLGEGAVGLVVEASDSALGVGGLVGEVALVEDRGGGVQLGVLDRGAVVVRAATAPNATAADWERQRRRPRVPPLT